MNSFIQDMQYAVRQLRKSWAFTLVVVVTLALGIGANTAVFSVMNAILMQLLPVRHPEGLSYVVIANDQGQAPGAINTGDSDSSFSEDTFEALRQRTDVFEELIGYVPLSFTGSVAVRHGGLPEVAAGEEVSGNFFTGVGTRIDQGRGFSLDDEKNHAQIAVLSYDYWTSKFARDPGVLGKTLFVKGVPMTITGVAARGFKGIEPASSTDFWIPLQNNPLLNAWGAPADSAALYTSPKWWCLRLMARVRPGISGKQAQQALTGTFISVVEKTLGKVDPKKWKPLLDFVPARGIAGYNEEFREPVKILMGLVALVLLIACVNVAMMVQARNAVRQREFSLRMALGAGKMRVFRQLLIESLLLVVAGAMLGWLFALSATHMLSAWSGIETGLSPDLNVLLFTLAISAVAAIVFGLVPLWSAVNAPVASVLRASAINMTANRTRILGGRIVLATQMAICLVLLVAAGLLLRTLNNYSSQSLGIQTEGLVVFDVTPQGDIESHVFYRTLLDRLRQAPGVASVSMAGNRPGSGWSSNNDLILDGVEQQGVSLRSNDLGAGFFHTMGVPILAGRDFLDTDTKDTPPVAIVNESLAKKFFAHGSPIGHRIGGEHSMTIVGVVADSKYTSVAEAPQPMAYYATMQGQSLGTMSIEVRTHGDARAMLSGLRRVVAQAYPNVPVEKPMTQLAQFEKSYERQRMFAAMGGFFGILAAVLVATGLYGTHSFRVSRRTSEIGVRMALGATRGQVLMMVMRESLWILLAGLIVGLPLTYMAMGQLKSMLYQMSPLDPASFAIAIAAMIVVASLSALIPARRASRLEPMKALRTE
ncbi:ABC transporter permease [Acidicapsa ligni]|uniref:ABC transporter permease n=1 Tax=Acidicapsa ligni TaxID=542300 RepID=UPI0021DFB30A|nr:ABC transporter permease [Acidicapsa ligni]